jgi:hypothetical protein
MPKPGSTPTGTVTRIAPPRPVTSTPITTLASFGPIAGGRADLLYGATGATKTSRLGDVAEWIKQKYGLESRMISADPGGWSVIEELVKSKDNPTGIINTFALIQHREYLYETVQKLCLGWWPSDPTNPQSVLVAPKDNGLRDIGALFIEGLTSICDILFHTNMTDLENIQVPEMPKDSRITSGEYVRRFAGRSDYMGVQDAIAEFVRDSGMLPVKKVIWTALEQKGEGENKKPVYGPDISGQKATGRCGPWFGNMLHIQKTARDVQVDDPSLSGRKITVSKAIPFIYLRDHIDPTDTYKLPWPAKTRAPRKLWQKVPDFMEPDLAKFYTKMDELEAEAKAARGEK